MNVAGTVPHSLQSQEGSLPGLLPQAKQAEVRNSNEFQIPIVKQAEVTDLYLDLALKFSLAFENSDLDL